MATYYVDFTGGNDGNGGQVEDDAWKTINKVQITLTGDQSDTIVKFKRGEVWREQYTVAGHGTSGHPFVHTDYGSGDLPKIYGSTEVVTWETEGSNIWYAEYASDPNDIWFITTGGVVMWGDEEAIKGDLNAEYEWWWDSGNTRIYVFAESDPDTRYNAIEAPVRNNCVFANQKDYIHIKNLEVGFTSWQIIRNQRGNYWLIDRS